ncbi:hypothetical protein CAEBREN_02697 [Caenorhabditis brenneri]|uniref:Uncharacterized protein n=1 Tax=Caenorhabditis brenneri TaxID=135651 RepID=G0M846_CAEBE|nr:hypothetical protein CAEBREN_02697 [Caenorhabditis brenneri]
MVGVTFTNSHVQQWNCENNMKKQNLCEVCFKPFNLANIDMHLEAGCAAEIYHRYNITPVKTPTDERKSKRTKKKSDRKSKKATKITITTTRKEKSTQ